MPTIQNQAKFLTAISNPQIFSSHPRKPKTKLQRRKRQISQTLVLEISVFRLPIFFFLIYCFFSCVRLFCLTFSRFRFDMIRRKSNNPNPICGTPEKINTWGEEKCLLLNPETTTTTLRLWRELGEQNVGNGGMAWPAAVWIWWWSCCG